ncbi:MAG: phytoene desaturase family protein [Actinomycetes bacterium]
MTQPPTQADVPTRADVVVVGAGHNGLVSATLLARAGLDVVVCEAKDTLGGATRTEQPFTRVPGLRQSTGSCLLGLMPPEVLQIMGADLPVVRRDPHYFLPTTGSRYLLFGRDREATRRQMEEFFSPADWKADEAMNAEVAALRDDLAPAWLTEPLSVEDTAERYVRPDLRQAFVALCRGSVADYLARFDFSSELLVAMYAVTDGLSGLHAGPDTPGSGHNFLVHNMCRLPGSDGTWMIVRGGMGTVSQTFAAKARQAGATLVEAAPVTQVRLDAGAASGVLLANGREISARVVLGACDPFRLASLVGNRALPVDLRDRLERVRRPGTTMKVNLALRDLPRFSCLPESAPSPFGSTVHLLPDTAHPMHGIRRMWDDVLAGRLPDAPTIEWYVHTTVDPSLQDPDGHHSSALFVQSVPYDIAGSSWEAQRESYTEHLLGIVERFAPGTRDMVADTFPLAPPDIERHFGTSYGHIHHVDNGVAFADRMPYATGVPGVYAGSAGTHPAGSVIGAAGHNAAQRILADLGLPRAS